jgi:hypothetical protein
MSRYALLIPCLLLTLALGAGPDSEKRECELCQEAAKKKREACYAEVDKQRERDRFTQRERDRFNQRAQNRVKTDLSIPMLKVECGFQFTKDQRACSAKPGCGRS